MKSLLRTGFYRSIMGATASGGVAVFTPLDLFAASEVGEFWLVDPAYLYTDTAATTLVSAPGDLVAAWKGAKYGLLATQATSGIRPSYARQPIGGWTQQLLSSGDLSDAVWSKTRCTVTTGQTDPNSGSTADLIECNSAGQTYVSQVINRQARQATLSVIAKAGTVNRIYIGMRLGVSTYSDNIVDLVSGAKVLESGSTTLVVTDTGGGWWKIELTRTGAYNGIHYIGPVNSASSTPTASVGANIVVWQPQFEYAAARSTYQARAATATAAPLSGDSAPALYFPGGLVGHRLTTSAAIDLTSTAAVSIAAKVENRIASNDYAPLCGFGADINATAGSFLIMLDTNSTTEDRIFPAMRGTATYGKQTASIPMPYNSRLIVQMDMDTDAISVHRDGADEALPVTFGTNSGTGNFGNHTFSVGERSDALAWGAAMTLTRGLVLIDRALTTEERDNLDAWLVA